MADKAASSRRTIPGEIRFLVYMTEDEVLLYLLLDASKASDWINYWKMFISWLTEVHSFLSSAYCCSVTDVWRFVYDGLVCSLILSLTDGVQWGSGLSSSLFGLFVPSTLLQRLHLAADFGDVDQRVGEGGRSCSAVLCLFMSAVYFRCSFLSFQKEARENRREIVNERLDMRFAGCRA